MKNKRIKIIFVILSIIIAYSFINYISTPMVKALEARDSRVDLTNVKLIDSEGPTDGTDVIIKTNEGCVSKGITLPPELVERLNYERGYCIGNHTWTEGSDNAWYYALNGVMGGRFTSLFCQQSRPKISRYRKKNFK